MGYFLGLSMTTNHRSTRNGGHGLLVTNNEVHDAFQYYKSILLMPDNVNLLANLYVNMAQKLPMSTDSNLIQFLTNGKIYLLVHIPSRLQAALTLLNMILQCNTNKNQTGCSALFRTTNKIKLHQMFDPHLYPSLPIYTVLCILLE